MDATKITNGVWFVRIPEAELYVLCGCPPDIVKHLMRRGAIAETQKKGWVFETGPNAILLSDVAIQSGTFCNMAEFPLMQIYYRQGYGIPGHVNCKGRKTIFMGLRSQLVAQSAYIARGTFGLENAQEIEAAGIRPEYAQEILRYKIRFAGGKPRDLGETADFAPTDSGKAELPGGVTVIRKSLNMYSFKLGAQEVEVDMNLAPGQTYEPPVRLDSHRVERDYFSVVHSGEGNGWDKDHPCMSSIVVFQGKIYLIDTGPYVLDSLTALGISVNELEGIFHTHAHDDHFAGLTSLVRTDHRIKYFATPLVRSSVMKKLSAVMSLPEKSFESAFEFHDLAFGKWNDVGGLEVQPILSLHPLETTILFFRALGPEGYKTYAHLADIPPAFILKDYLLDDPGATELSEKLYENSVKSLHFAVDLKKIDAGGGMIHGRASDFEGDRSSKVVLSHISGDLSAADKEIGSNASFGLQDVLIESRIDYTRRLVERHLAVHFPEASPEDRGILLNCPLERLNTGHVILRKGAEAKDIHLVACGVVEMIDSGTGTQHMLSTGTMIGEVEALANLPSSRTYRAKSAVTLLRIPSQLLLKFAHRNYDIKEMMKRLEIEYFLQGTRLFGEMVSSAVHNVMSRALSSQNLAEGTPLTTLDGLSLVVARSGKASVLIEGSEVDVIGPGGVFGEESVFFGRTSLMTAKVIDEGEFLSIPRETIRNVPIIEWKLLETYERRMTRFGLSHGDASPLLPELDSSIDPR
jgi:hemerythrin